MRKILLLVVCVMTLAACSNVQVMGYEKVDASETIVTETYNLKPFEKIDVKGVANVEIKQNEEKNGLVELKAPDNYIELFKFDSKDGRLVIDLTKKVNIDARNVLITVYTSDLTALSNSGVSHVSMDSLDTDKLEVINSGVGDIQIGGRHGERCGVSEVRRASEGEEHASEWRRRYLRRIKQIAPVFSPGLFAYFTTFFPFMM